MRLHKLIMSQILLRIININKKLFKIFYPLYFLFLLLIQSKKNTVEVGSYLIFVVLHKLGNNFLNYAISKLIMRLSFYNLILYTILQLVPKFQIKR